MTTIKLHNKELKIKYGYEATVKSGIIQTLSSFSESSSVEDTLKLLPELILVGVQKYHSDEFGYDYDDPKSKEAALSKIYSLVDDYFDDDDADFIGMVNALQEELTKNGFLAKMLRDEKAGQPKK